MARRSQTFLFLLVLALSLPSVALGRGPQSLKLSLAQKQKLAPVNVSPPYLTGTPVVGDTLTGNPGSWTGTTISYSHQWYSCTDLACSPLAGAKSATDVLTAADANHSVFDVVTASNRWGKTSVATAADTVLLAPPASTSLPVISGIAQTGQLLTASTGGWSGSPTSFAYQWLRCDSAGGSCLAVTGQNAAASYLLSLTDVGFTMRVTVTATNAGGSSAATSAASAVAASTPATVSITSPSAGATVSGQVSFAASVANQVPARVELSVDTASPYVDTTSPYGYTLDTTTLANGTHTLAAKAVLSDGSSVSASITVSVQNAVAAPASTSLPVISGTAQAGQLLTASTGGWSGSPTSFTYQWLRCNSSGGSCLAVTGQNTSASYQLSPTDVGFTMRVTVTATNTGGSSSATSAASAVVASTPAPTGSSPSPSSTTAYGNGWTADGLANLEIGKTSGRKIAIRFRAARSGTIASARVYLIFRALGYYAGNGGQVRCELQADSGGVPSGVALAGSTITDPMAQGPFRTFTLGASVTGGQVYYLVFTNPASDPVNNYVSIDDLSNAGAAAQPDSDLAIVWKYDSTSAWTVNAQHTPIVQIGYGDGSAQGQGYIDALSSSGLVSVQGSTVAQETFTPAQSVTVSSVRLRARISGTPAGPLTVTLAGVSATVPASAFSTSYGWVSVPLAVTLPAGAAETLTLSAPAGSGSYQTFPYQKGAGNGLTAGVFADGHFVSGSRTDLDLPFSIK